MDSTCIAMKSQKAEFYGGILIFYHYEMPRDLFQVVKLLKCANI